MNPKKGRSMDMRTIRKIEELLTEYYETFKH